ncbi:mechanosensitive ion channel [Thermodesulfovibrio aggregans]|uniref:Mechanosensitive ion channel n=1 Tax=Thermodesulfovibrio aggregans TaxID=86166 RepID=A0A0U9HXU1_9BACT|nr:DUF5752 family protein [Thermodesulfovibrio aggregans]GAQ95535.1 mechanosensitive ion channel [Thermodesulfovibrio aggregans]
MFEWFERNWFTLFVPLTVFVSFVILAFFIRFKFSKYIIDRLKSVKWAGKEILISNLAIIIFYSILILGAYTAVELSPIKGNLYIIICRVLITVFLISLTYVLFRAGMGILNLYSQSIKKPLLKPFQRLKNAMIITFITVGILILFEIWKFPTTPFIIFIILACAIAFFALRENISNFIAGFEIINGEIIKKGDYIKLESGEEGSVLNITWRHIEIKSFDEKIVIIPNSKIVKSKLEILRKPPKKAKEPFRFYTRLNSKELTGLKARNLTELLKYIKEVPDSVIFYHTHDFIEEYHYLIPQPSNEFALWIGNALGFEALAEKLSTIDIFEFSNIGEIRKRLSDIIEEYINNNPSDKNCEEGEEFHFIKSISVIMPTPYIAHDLREFVQILKFISPNSLFFHIYEAKLRVGKIANDFSLWLSESLGEEKLAEAIMSIDPYMHTIEGIRSQIISIVESYLDTEVAVG